VNTVNGDDFDDVNMSGMFSKKQFRDERKGVEELGRMRSRYALCGTLTAPSAH